MADAKGYVPSPPPFFDHQQGRLRGGKLFYDPKDVTSFKTLSYGDEGAPAVSNEEENRKAIEELERKFGELTRWAWDEFTFIARSIMQQDFFILNELHVAPSKPREGMIVSADGTDWNPGSGKGIYAYLSGSWTKLS